MRRDAKRCRSIDVAEEVRWQLAEEYAGAVDVARVNQNARELLAAGRALESVLEQLKPAEPKPPEGGSSGDGGESGNEDLYGRPPTVGDAADA